MIQSQSSVRFAELEFDQRYSTFLNDENVPQSATRFKLSGSQNRSVKQDEVIIREKPVHSLAVYDGTIYRFKHPAIGELTRLLDAGKVQEAIHLLGVKMNAAFADLKPEDVTVKSYGTKYTGPYGTARMVRETLSDEQKAKLIEHFKNTLPALVQDAVDSHQIKSISSEIIRRFEGIRRKIFRQQPVETTSLTFEHESNIAALMTGHLRVEAQFRSNQR